MAGSYNHAVSKRAGKLLNNQNFTGMIENLGDAYEMAEEMYGMIHYLAAKVERLTDDQMQKDIVEEARKNYRRGLQMSPGVQPESRTTTV
ncbi:hypothetical protein PP914_gp155 [Arthrobacter phage Qui]|uniref:Uncharacterized protein n=1 Tax=Arthrobacter phage Qui TaxID=2603260 RepID=A0A5B8WG03_9CAUD|nr:hypothetical protein PP914_gp155 [Arthrobacter phage Qui]QED11644.1 hypothetical protein SEA_QUI_155 [Arthrobacter phage Qui]QOC56476.1 hypothetical protein SEA_PAELLA_155 [Arthrobacter phage Paella]